MDTIAVKVLEGLTSLALEKFKLLWSAKDDAERMKDTVQAIRAVLLDAEAKAKNHEGLTLWLRRLKDVLYDADDLLDDLSTEALRREIMTRNKLAKKVRIFFSKSNQVVYNLKMGHKITEIRKRLDDIDDNKKKFELTEKGTDLDLTLVNKERKETYSFVQENEIIGREKEKDLILSHLSDTNGGESSVSIIPIVGIGGLGKTALAQLVYNHEDVQNNFELQGWVCVSDEFDIKKIAQNILGDETNKNKTIEQVQNDLGQLIGGKRFLLVLDDVWNENSELWNKLKSLLMGGARGSKIIVTTRNTTVGDIMGTYPPVPLKGLDGETSWMLFRQMAFEERKEPNNLELVTIAKEIAKRCAGVPLAIRTVGSLIYSLSLKETDWSYFKDLELWKIDQEEKRIFSILDFSYDHLPSPQKNCFAYCSLFPKDFQFRKRELIQMWVAEGFIQPSNLMRSEEDVGHEYFMNLLSRSFFQDVERNVLGDIISFKMHDLMHDLARSIAKNEYAVIDEGKEESITDTTRHLSYIKTAVDLVCEMSTSILQSGKLRTVLFGVGNYLNTIHLSGSLPISNLMFLRVLVLSSSDILEIPKGIGKLKHLRYLDLSNTAVSQVPWFITRLVNLQTLKLKFCCIIQWPRDINKLKRLRNLDLFSRTLTCMPQELGQLTSLQTLSQFAVTDKKIRRKSYSARISELGGLNNLRGDLLITGLEHLRAIPEEAESAKLLEKQNLRRLILSWDGKSKAEEDESSISQVASKDELILERLRPHQAIEALWIKGFCGKELPNWIGNLSSLRYIYINKSKYLTSLPPGLQNLTSLESLRISDCSSELSKRCRKESGDDWPKISHIPKLDIDD